jgi:predicted DNA binding CopG/RHH family protein
MDKLIQPPVGLTESEEADWWYANRDTVSEEFVQAFDEDRVHSGKLIPPSQRAASVQLDLEDAKKASVLAAKRGIDYQTYIKKLVHEAVERDYASETAEAA